MKGTKIKLQTSAGTGCLAAIGAILFGLGIVAAFAFFFAWLLSFAVNNVFSPGQISAVVGERQLSIVKAWLILVITGLLFRGFGSRSKS